MVVSVDGEPWSNYESGVFDGCRRHPETTEPRHSKTSQTFESSESSTEETKSIRSNLVGASFSKFDPVLVLIVVLRFQDMLCCFCRFGPLVFAAHLQLIFGLRRDATVNHAVLLVGYGHDSSVAELQVPAQTQSEKVIET